MDMGEGASQGSMDGGALERSMEGAGDDHDMQEVEGAGAVQAGSSGIRGGGRGSVIRFSDLPWLALSVSGGVSHHHVVSLGVLQQSRWNFCL